MQTEKKSDFFGKNSSCLMPDFGSSLASLREASEPQSKGEKTCVYSLGYFLPDNEVKVIV